MMKLLKGTKFSKLLLIPLFTLFAAMGLLALVYLRPSAAPAADPCTNSSEFKLVDGVGPACRMPNGLLKVRWRSNQFFFTHGHDPKDQIVKSGGSGGAGYVPPIQPASCVDTTRENYNHVIYAYVDGYDNYNARRPDIDYMFHQANGYLRYEGSRYGLNLNYKVKCDAGGLIISKVRLNTDSRYFSDVANDLYNQGYGDSKAKYWVWRDGPGFMAVGFIYYDDALAFDNRNNDGPNYGIVSIDVRGLSGALAGMHENGHTMGAVQNSSPNSTGANHCNDGYDVMCYGDGGSRSNYQVICGDRTWLDCNNNDYFNPYPQGGSYLSDHWSMASGLNPYISGLPRPSDTTAPSRPGNLNSPSQTRYEITIAWDASSDNVAIRRYDIYRNGSFLALTDQTSYYDSQLTWDTQYDYRVIARDYAGNSSSPADLSVRTRPGPNCIVTIIFCIENPLGQ